MNSSDWKDVGAAEEFKKHEVSEATLDKKKIAVTCKNGELGVIAGTCLHVGGPLGKGRLAGDYVVCPWHNWTFHRVIGKAEPGYGDDAVPQYQFKEENGRLLVNPEPLTQGHKSQHAPHALARPVQRQAGPVRVAGISTSVMDPKNPRYSTSEALLQVALDHAAAQLKCETKIIKLNDLHFRSCEGYYSKAARACTWPCSITQMDKKDELTEVYEALVHWADVILVATPIRWGAASALYFKMAERLNCIQNQVTIANRVLIQNKVASFIITGGQDNIQAVAGQMLGFFAEIGFHFPQFPYIAHSRGWSAEDMQRNVEYVMKSEELREGARTLAERSVELAGILLKTSKTEKTSKGGRKAQPILPAS